MKLLLDTHLLLWAAGADIATVGPGGMSREAAALIDEPSNVLWFSAASPIWSIERLDATALRAPLR